MLENDGFSVRFIWGAVPPQGRCIIYTHPLYRSTARNCYNLLQTKLHKSSNMLEVLYFITKFCKIIKIMPPQVRTTTPIFKTRLGKNVLNCILGSLVSFKCCFFIFNLCFQMLQASRLDNFQIVYLIILIGEFKTNPIFINFITME
jgi:hypothetical protein